MQHRWYLGPWQTIEADDWYVALTNVQRLVGFKPHRLSIACHPLQYVLSTTMLIYIAGLHHLSPDRLCSLYGNGTFAAKRQRVSIAHLPPVFAICWKCINNISR